MGIRRGGLENLTTPLDSLRYHQRRSSGAAAWTDPTNAEGTLNWWYDISNSGSITSSSGGLRISNVNDLSGNGHHLTRSGAADPHYLQPALNGLDGMEFQDADDCLMTSGIFSAITAPYLITIVFVPGANTNNRTVPVLFATLGAFGNWRNDGLSGHASAGFSNNIDSGVTCSSGTGYWMQVHFLGTSSSTVHVSGGTIQTGDMGSGGDATEAILGLDDGSTVQQRTNATICEAFSIQNATSNDLTNSKLYVGTKWNLATS